MKKNEKLFIIAEVLYSITHDEFVMSRGEFWLFNPDGLYRNIYKQKITYGIRTIRYEEKVVVFPAHIFICCPYELDDLDKFLLHFVHRYSKIYYMNMYPLLPASKITFKERRIEYVKDIIAHIKEVFHK